MTENILGCIILIWQDRMDNVTTRSNLYFFCSKTIFWILSMGWKVRRIDSYTNLINLFLTGFWKISSLLLSKMIGTRYLFMFLFYFWWFYVFIKFLANFVSTAKSSVLMLETQKTGRSSLLPWFFCQFKILTTK